ncbi:hypothetical protein [Streptomyces sp. NPDC060205]|uniref:hypothetical protein n=1 Tax=Streptomyces sp. NPDC060205 TaxID=3347072 RepID=UPI003667B036
MTVTGEWICGWAARMDALCSTHMGRFASAFGYPPDENCVTRAASSAAVEGLPDDLVTFYRRVEQVSLPDVGSGFFVHPEGQTVAGLCGDLPTRIVGPREDSVVVFGSDGGGALFALSAIDGSTVYRLPPSRVEARLYTAGAVPPEVVASDRAGFLSLLERELAAVNRAMQ